MTRRTTIITALAAALIAAVGLALFLRSDQGRDEVVLAAILPLTGDDAQWGIPPRQGIELAIDEANASGGIGGRKIRLAVEDTACDPKLAVTAFTKLLSVDEPAAVIGEICSASTLAVAPLAERRKVVLISPGSTSPKLTDAGAFVFRVVPSDALRGQVFARYVYNELKYKKVGFLYINNASGVGNRDSFSKTFEDLGGTIAVAEAYAADATDVRTQLTRLKNSDVEAVVIVSFPSDTVLVLTQAAELDVGKPLLFQTEAVEDPTVLRNSGRAAEGTVYILPAPPSGDEAEAFKARFKKKFGTESQLFAAEGYDAARLVLRVLAEVPKAASDSELLRERLASTRDYPGASGTISFDEHGDVKKPMAIKRVVNGRPELIKQVSY